MEFFTRVISEIAGGSGFAYLPEDWRQVLMIGIACILLYMGIGKGYEPLLMVPIAFGMLLANLALPLSGLMAEPDTANHTVGFMWVLYQGVAYAIYPSIIFMGIGAMTDFGPLLANPTSLLLGAAAQLGIFAAFLMALCVGPITSALNGVMPFIPVINFTPADAAAIGVIGGADGPTAILTASKLANKLMPAIAIAAYSYMALIPMIQPPLMKALTSKEARQVKMSQLRQVSKTEKIIFPIAVTIFVILLIPSTAPLIGCLMFGNLLRECGVLNSLAQTAQNEFANIITLLLGITISFSMQAEQFVTWETFLIMGLGLIAFIFDSIGGCLFAKLLNLFLKEKINPMIGAAGISAFPMSARVVQSMATKEDRQNHLLMHAIGANVSGQIGSVIAGGIVLYLVPQFVK